jgi:hypothetical protein
MTLQKEIPMATKVLGEFNIFFVLTFFMSEDKENFNLKRCFIMNVILDSLKLSYSFSFFVELPFRRRGSRPIRIIPLSNHPIRITRCRHLHPTSTAITVTWLASSSNSSIRRCRSCRLKFLQNQAPGGPHCK